MKYISLLLFLIAVLCPRGKVYAACSSPISRTNFSPNTVVSSSTMNTQLNAVFNKVNDLDGDCLTDSSVSGAKLEDTSITGAKLAAGAIAALGISSKTTAYTLTAADDVISADATTAAFTLTLPAAASSSGQVFYIRKSDSSANEVTIDANGSETIGGSLTRKLALQYDSITIACDGSNWIVLQNNSTSEVIVDGGNGHGSVSTKIRRFSNIRRAIGGAIAFSDAATTASVFTINEPGVYSITWTDRLTTADDFMAITVNDSALTTNVSTPLTYAQGIRATSFTVSTRPGTISWTGRLAINDVVRMHSNGGFENGNNTFTMVTITKVKE
jgi:hypothetical protein